MKIPTVEKFLCCLRLETGATILGWWGAIGAAIGLFVVLIGFGVAIVDFPLLANVTQNADTHSLLSVNNPPSQFVTIVVLFFATLYCAISLYACATLIRSVKNRSSRQVRPYLILIGLETIVAFLTILQFTWDATANAIIGTAINGYIFVCMNSLREIFRDEAMRGYNRQYQRAMIEKV